MSQFLPETQAPPEQPGFSGVPDAPAPAGPADTALMQRVLAAAAQNPNLIPASFMAYMIDWIQTQRLVIPISQVFGWQRVVSGVATVFGRAGSVVAVSGDYSADKVTNAADKASAATQAFSAAIGTAPAVSQTAGLALGSAFQNTLGYDVLLVVALNVTVNTSGVLKVGVGPTNTPTQQTIMTGVTTTGQMFIPIYLPKDYYALLSTTGTITLAIDGQVAYPV